MDKLIPVINKLQDVFNTVGSEQIQLPQIVVVGAQSSGKSSVLENIVGRDFLPRGSGICTRCPLILQLVYTKNGEEEWGEFYHRQGEKFFDFDKIRQEIENQTVQLSGENKGISNTPINLKIFSPHVLNLTLVDLPGITKVAIGDQPEDIEVQIYDLITSFIRNPNSIILAVTPANMDLANSDALKLAKEQDPGGNRTIAVVTKIDLMDAGTDATDILSGRVYPVKLGIIGVVNRSQQDIVDGKPIREALEAEAGYFNSHKAYRAVASRCGTPYLAKALNKHLMHHIRECLPELKSRISSMIAQTTHTLSAYGDPVLQTVNRGALLLQVLTRFSSKYCSIIDGVAKELSTSELCGGARICYIFHETFGRTLDMVDPLDGLDVNDIRTAIRNATGPRPALFVPEVSFELLVKKQIKRLEDPSLRCCELVHEELNRIVFQCEGQELMRFHKLRQQVIDVVNSLLKARLPLACTMIENLIEMELAYINTNHPDFMGGSAAVSAMMERKLDEEYRLHLNRRIAKNEKTRQEQDPQHAQQQQKPEPKVENKAPGPLNGETGRHQAGGKAGLFNYFFGDKAKADENGVTQGMQKMTLSPSNITAQMNEFESPTAHMLAASDAKLNSRELVETELIQSLISSYFNIVRKNIQDSVPKAVMHFLVNHIKENIQSELVSTLYREDMFDELLEEAPQIARERQEAADLLKALRQASAILSEVRDTN
eukprot:Nk52_evm33s236 gene=Nk52_evmTU33s236